MPLHRDLTGPQLHEPKGAAAASSGQVYVANGSGSGTWTALSSLVSLPIVVRKTADTSSTDATLADDTHLTGMSLSGSTVYRVEGDLYWNNVDGTTAGIKMTFAVDTGSLTGSQVFWTNLDPDNGTVQSSGENAVTDTFTVSATSGTDYCHTRISGYISVNSAATLSLQFAQDTVDGSNATVLYEGSALSFSVTS